MGWAPGGRSVPPLAHGALAARATEIDKTISSILVLHNSRWTIRYSHDAVADSDVRVISRDKPPYCHKSAADQKLYYGFI
jgi:hypothetical protein